MADADDYHGWLTGQIEGQAFTRRRRTRGPMCNPAGEPVRGAGKINALNSVWRHLIFVALFPIQVSS